MGTDTIDREFFRQSGAIGGRLGGVRRKERLSAARRKEIARIAGSAPKKRAVKTPPAA